MGYNLLLGRGSLSQWRHLERDGWLKTVFFCVKIYDPFCFKTLRFPTSLGRYWNITIVKNEVRSLWEISRQYVDEKILIVCSLFYDIKKLRNNNELGNLKSLRGSVSVGSPSLTWRKNKHQQVIEWERWFKRLPRLVT